VLRVSLKQEVEKNVDRIGRFGEKWSFLIEEEEGRKFLGHGGRRLVRILLCSSTSN
jgi:hypothetical protein